MFNVNFKKVYNLIINLVIFELENNDVRLKKKDVKIECNLKFGK